MGFIFLIDLGCTTNLLAKRMLEELPAATRAATLDIAGLARQAGRSKFVLQRVVELPVPGQVQGVTNQEAFAIGEA